MNEENKNTCVSCGVECKNSDNPKCANCCLPGETPESTDAPTTEAPTEDTNTDEEAPTV